MDSLKLVPYIEDRRLFEYAASCANSLRDTLPASGKADAAALRQSFMLLEKCHSVLKRRYSDSARVPAACEWLLDNRYIIQREYPSAISALSHARTQRSCRGRLIITQLCRSLLQAGQGKLSAERCSIFLEGFQSSLPLQRDELILFPAALRCVIIEALAGCAEKLQSSADTAAQAEEFEALFASMRLLDSMDTDMLLDSADMAGKIFSHDPGGYYPRMDRQTRGEYLDRLSLMAKRSGCSELELAKKLAARAEEENRHIGFYLFPAPSPLRSVLYITVLCFTSLFLSLLAACSSRSIIAGLLLFLPIWAMVKGFADFILLHCIKPRPLPRLDISEGIPEEGKTICVISALLGCTDAGRLEELRLASRSEGRNLLFGLLADLPAADSENRPEDKELIARAKKSVEELNRKYGGGFYFFYRRRSFDGEGWSGHERKRGALLELAKLLCGSPSSLIAEGDTALLSGTRYIVSLDADTRIYPGSISKLVGAAMHPMCRPVIDKKRGLVTSGHAIIHPRIETELESATATDFALIFAGSGGSDPYGGLCGELYMDAFDNGGFAGKGLIDAEALLECSEKHFPRGRVLSHDALEGAYLKGAYMSDAEFSDAFPSDLLSYYKRQHRWIRGDWQNSGWIFARELSAMDRFRLFDSLRRSLNAPLTLLAIVFGLCSSGIGLRLAAWAALLSLLQSIFLSLAESGLARPGSPRLRRHTRLLNGVGGAIVRCFMQLWLLPFEAWVNLSATFTALWRMLISHKKMLQWQTFAQSGSSADFSGHIKTMWPAVVLGVLLMAFSPTVIGKASGFMWLLSPAAGWALALPAYKEDELSLRDRELLLSSVSDHWLYLKELSGKQDNFLPPDNFQQQPPIGSAHRTSPTNIGLALAAAAALAKAGIIKRSEAERYTSRMLPALESMAKYRGHFFNWYDTQNLRPLSPAHISTVDSGNMYAGLLTCTAALESWGSFELADRLKALMADMDFSFLYDSLRELFYISYDPKKQRGVGGWYDLMASEAMLTSYLAISKGDIPLKHWRRLSRAQLQKDGYRGLASWTGTMFEYLMPALFLPVYRSSLLYESDRFCLYAQRRRRYPGKPWGISESAFYSLDAALNYRYKAHGCPALALKRGQETDMVISPYSSFLALCAAPRAAAANLRRLKELGAYGRWGFMEALDFSPGRCSREDGEQVRCWMAHHVSMSILAGVNALDKGSVRQLFLSSPDMAAHTLLLQEKLPDGAVLIRKDTGRIPERPRQKLRQPWQLQGGTEDRREQAALISNGAYSIRLKNTGDSAAHLGDICIYGLNPEDSLKLEINGAVLGDGISPDSWTLGEERCRWNYSREDFQCSISRGCAEGELGEFIELELKALSSAPCDIELSFRPILALARDYLSHSAYWKLGMSASARGNELMLRRLSKGDSKELWLCLACSEVPCFDADRAGGLGPLADPFVSVSLTFTPSSSVRRLRFALCIGTSEKQAAEGARRILYSPTAGAGNMAGAAAARLGLSRDEMSRAMELVLPLWENMLSKAPAQKELWPFGISGELPLLCCDGGASESEWLLKAFCLLKSCGLEAELVFLSSEEGEYMQPLRGRIQKLLSEVGLEALLGSPGGVFIVPGKARDILTGRAAVFIGTERRLPAPIEKAFEPGRRIPGRVPEFHWTKQGFEYSTKSFLTPRIWQHIITNGNLSAFAADFGPAGLWLKNAREMKLIAPPADIMDGIGNERIYLSIKGRNYSLFAADDGCGCHVLYAPGYVRWEKDIAGRHIESTMFIHPACSARILLVKGAAGLELFWEAEPHMGLKDSASLDIRLDSILPMCTNPESYFENCTMRFAASVPFESRALFRPAGLKLGMKAEDITSLVCGSFSPEYASSLCSTCAAEDTLQGTAARWQELSGRIKVHCRSKALEHYMNSWAVYQSLACRIQARSSIYQSGGAIGFRDQLQDCVNLMLIDPGLARAQILDCCRHQYEQGDVMHWWHPHPEGDKGIRSRCSDDLLWLVWALCRYCEATGDTELCRKEVPFITSPPLEDGEKDRYEIPSLSSRSATVLEHARAALEQSISRGFGEHGLPLMGSGDWNDGLDRIGGESVWLAWFFSCCAQSFAMLLKELDEDGFERYEEISKKLGIAADACHNGLWYLRAFFPDGSIPGGSKRIDSIAQSWAVFCPWSTEEKRIPALCSAIDRLFDRKRGIVRLLNPPYSPEESDCGYISGYGEGFRENGGQYSHGAVWLAIAALKCDLVEEGWEILRCLLPEQHEPSLYSAEPFVLAADVYSAAGREGLAGWSWYTGSAGWYFHAVTSELLGLKLQKGRLYIRPCLPLGMSSYELEWKSPGGKVFHIVCSESGIRVNGEEYRGEGLII